ncbi:MAG: diaminopimelate epimerase [Verrucomicrobiota bacterium]
MNLPFTKMSGAGNDFIVVDNRDLGLPLNPDQVARLCDRHFGIGADGLLAVEPPANGADFRMRYYNADGGEADMCGNGARCFARFVRGLNGEREAVSFETPAGLIRARYHGDEVEVNLTEPFDLRLGMEIDLAGGPATVHHINTGVPHVVQFVHDLPAFPVVERGRELRRHEAFAPSGANANFIQCLEGGVYGIRTYERGVEDETLACGTGVSAGAIIAHLVEDAALPVRVQVRGGDLLAVNFSRDGDRIHDVSLRGPADISFTGEINLQTLHQPVR